MIGSSAGDPDLFRDGRLGFELRKPSTWRFLPPSWSPLERAKRSLESDDIFRLAGTPFCCAMRDQGKVGIAHPTLQVVMRPFPAPSQETLPSLLETFVSGTKVAYPTLELEDSWPQEVLAGFPAIGFRATFDFLMVDGQVETRIRARTRSHVIFARGLAFTIGLSGSNDPAHYDEQDFTDILASVRIR